MSEKENPIRLSASAAARICALVAAKTEKQVLRLAVAGGGCSGFQYDFSLEETNKAEDLVVQKDGATMVIDPVSVPFLKGAEVDFVQQPIGAYFKINNPNAISGCGCGSSFSVG